MVRTRNLLITVLTISFIILGQNFSLASQPSRSTQTIELHYTGPANVSQNTIPAILEDTSGDSLLGKYLIFAKWGTCDCDETNRKCIKFYKNGPYGEYTFCKPLIPESTGNLPNIYDRFRKCNDSRHRMVTLNRFDNTGYCIGGEYYSDTATGYIELEKSNPSLSYYDQAHLWGQHKGNKIDAYVSFVEHNGYIGIPNILSVIYRVSTGGNKRGETYDQNIWVPLAEIKNRQQANDILATVIFDINADGIADKEFPSFPPLYSYSSMATAPIPTLSEWGQILFVFCMFITSIYYVRKSIKQPLV